MRKSSWTPSIVPSDDQNVYLVVDDFGQFGRVWREADIEKTDLESVIDDLLHGQYNNPIGVFGFNPAEGWSRDVSSDVAQELRRRCDLQMRDVPSSAKFACGPSLGCGNIGTLPSGRRRRGCSLGF
jgi:hypothetical protein